MSRHSYYTDAPQAFTVLPPWRPHDGTAYDSTTGYRWSSSTPPPAVGDRVTVSMNGLGQGTVTGYFTQGGFLGLMVQLDAPPEWYVRQNAGNVPAPVFGAETKCSPTSMQALAEPVATQLGREL